MAKKILIIEDDSLLQESLIHILTTEGYEVRGSTNARVAFALMEEDQPDLIMTDLVILGTDGFEILKKLQENPDFAKIPTVVISNLGREKDIEKAKALGARDYIVKAENSLEQIVQKVRTILG